MNHLSELKNLIEDSLKKDHFFAVYRLPGEHDPQYILQINPEIESAQSDDSEEGFSMKAYDRESRDVWIKKDVYIEDFSQDFSVYEEINYNSTFNYQSNQELSKEDYITRLNELIGDIKQGEAEKVVYSRSICIDLEKNSIADTFLNLLSVHKDAFVFLVNLPGGITWIGASPETLISEKNLQCKSMALAATRKSNDDESWNEKETAEQEYVSAFIRERLHSSNISFEESPRYSKKLNSGLMHLCSDFTFRLNNRNQLSNVLSTLHPTPAVCGNPLDSAKDLIAKYEIHNREYYTGYLGPVNIDNSSNLYVNLRSAKCFDGKACLYVGGGITSASVSEDEWFETKMKSETILNALK